MAAELFQSARSGGENISPIIPAERKVSSVNAAVITEEQAACSYRYFECFAQGIMTTAADAASGEPLGEE